MRNTGLLLAGTTMIAEGAALALYGRDYLDFMERHGLVDLWKRAIRKLGFDSNGVLAASA